MYFQKKKEILKGRGEGGSRLWNSQGMGGVTISEGKGGGFKVIING